MTRDGAGHDAEHAIDEPIATAAARCAAVMRRRMRANHDIAPRESLAPVTDRRVRMQRLVSLRSAGASCVLGGE
jgi:hypothetical protein